MSFGNEQRPKYVFAGPTLFGTTIANSLAAEGFEIFPPAVRGDIDRLADRTPAIIVLIDGRFHQALAVGHAEIRRALAEGCDVWGLSSMGAIRAHEMTALGMRGYGRIFNYFRAVDDFQDDEVALLHSPEPPFNPITEPLVHYRHWLAHLESSGAISRDVALSVLIELKGRWFGDRTTAAALSLVRRLGGHAAGIAARTSALEFGPFRVKTQDVHDFVTARAWASPFATQTSPAAIEGPPLFNVPSSPGPESVVVRQM
jgi:hypothetical protein